MIAPVECNFEEQTTCCYAVQDKVWVDGPDGAKWEVYTVLADAEGNEGLGGDERCCTSATMATTMATDAVPASSSCC